MAKDRIIPTICLHVLLITLMISELTPDVRNVSSNSLLRIFVSGSAESQALTKTLHHCRITIPLRCLMELASALIPAHDPSTPSRISIALRNTTGVYW